MRTPPTGLACAQPSTPLPPHWQPTVASHLCNPTAATPPLQPHRRNPIAATPPVQPPGLMHSYPCRCDLLGLHRCGGLGWAGPENSHRAGPVGGPPGGRL